MPAVIDWSLKLIANHGRGNQNGLLTLGNDETALSPHPVTEDCDWLMLACLSENSTHLTQLLLLWEIEFGLKVQRMRGEITGFFIIKQMEKALTVLCPVVKQL